MFFAPEIFPKHFLRIWPRFRILKYGSYWPGVGHSLPSGWVTLANLDTKPVTAASFSGWWRMMSMAQGDTSAGDDVWMTVGHLCLVIGLHECQDMTRMIKGRFWCGEVPYTLQHLVIYWWIGWAVMTHWISALAKITMPMHRSMCRITNWNSSYTAASACNRVQIWEI